MTKHKAETKLSDDIQQRDISEKFVRDALAYLICTKPEKFVSPLWRLQVVNVIVSHPHFPRMADAHEYALSCLLTSAIVTHYRKCRHDLGLLPVPNGETPIQVEQTLQQMMRQSSKELVSWGLLYYRFVRVELALTPTQFSQWLHVGERTIRRYQAYGVRRLTEWLIGLEWAMRSGLPVSWSLSLYARRAEGFVDVLAFQPLQVSLPEDVRK